MSETLVETEASNVIEVWALTDVDGPLNPGGTPTTNGLLRRGTFVIPPESEPIEMREESDHFYSFLLHFMNLYFHKIRPIFKESKQSLQELQTLQESAPSKVQILLAVLSGREPYLHQMTRAKFDKILADIFDDYFLNPGYISAAWKELKVRQLVADGKLVTFVEDDLMAALRVARVNRRQVLVYLLKNKFYIPEYFEINNIELPPNVTLVDSYSQAVAKIKVQIKRLWDDNIE